MISATFSSNIWKWCLLWVTWLSTQAKVTGLPTKVRLVDLSRVEVPYGDAWKWQQSLLEYQMSVQDTKPSNSDDIAGHVLLMQHKSVYTLGSQTQNDWLRKTSVHPDLEYETFQVERGGEATYHGPGQLVLYPVIDLNYFQKDINLYLRRLEETVINTARDFSITAGRVEGLTGVWVGDSKISAIGIKLRRWVTMHGLSLNINPDIRYFDNIVPCGITNKAIGRLIDMNGDANIGNTANSLLLNFQREFEVEYLHDLPSNYKGETGMRDATKESNYKFQNYSDYQQACMNYLDYMVTSTCKEEDHNN